MSRKNLIRQAKLSFPDIDYDTVFKNKKAVLIDVDNTLYPYWPNHVKALAETLNYLKKKYKDLFSKLSLEQYSDIYQKHRKIVIQRLYPNGMCRNRYLLFISWMESLNIKRAYVLAQKLEKIYWDSFIKNMSPDRKAMEFLKYCYSHSIEVVAVTDMQADIQVRKIQKLKMDRYITYLVTSDEAGKEKPYKNIFEYSLKKLGLKSRDVIMIGDNAEKDLAGAAKLGIDTYKVD